MAFIQHGKERKVRLSTNPLRQFKEEFLSYSTANHSQKTQKACQTAVSEFIRIIGDKPIGYVSVRDTEYYFSM